MQRPIRPRWLIRLALELSGRGRGQPRNTNLRRATSTAYYALFHEIALSTASHALPGSTAAELQRATRHMTHTSIKTVAAWIAGETPPKHLQTVVARLRANADLTSVASAFADLHEQRERADYDHEAGFTRTGTRALVEQAARSITLLRSNRADDDFNSFLGLVVLRTTIR